MDAALQIEMFKCRNTYNNIPVHSAFCASFLENFECQHEWLNDAHVSKQTDTQDEIWR